MEKVNKNRLTLGSILLKGRTVIALIALLVVFGVAEPVFLTPFSLIMVAKHVAIYAILGIGMTAVIINGGIDLSVGSIVGFVGMIAGGFIYEGIRIESLDVIIYLSIPMVVIVSLLIGTLIGMGNGLIVSKLNVPPFIATLGTMYIFRGLAMIRSGGLTYPDLNGKAELGNTGFTWLGSGTFLSIPIAIWLMIIIAIVVIIIFKKTPLGWHIFAIGGNEKAAEMSGIKVAKIKTVVYMKSGFCAAVVGLIASSQLASAQPSTGESWEMNAIAAAVLGGTSMSGGVGSIVGTLIGAFVIGVLNDGMVMLNVSEFLQMVIKGAVIIVAVVVDMAQRKLESTRALKMQSESMKCA
jgi:erythritol transport system permease protein